VYKKQCEDTGRPFAVFTPYPDNWDGECNDECLAEQPCQLPCGDTQCSVSAFVRAGANGKRQIEYFIVGRDEHCADYIRALSFSAHNIVEYDRKCIARIGGLHCGDIAPYGGSVDFDFFDSSEEKASGLAELSSSDGGKRGRCVVKEDWCPKQRQSRFLVTFRPGFRGVVIEVPDDFVIAVEPVHLLQSDGSTYRCSRACTLELPVAKCGNTRCDGASSSGTEDLCAEYGRHALAAPPKPVIFVPHISVQAHGVETARQSFVQADRGKHATCRPPSATIGVRDNSDGGEARAWLAALEEQAYALAHCPRAPAPTATDAYSLALGSAERVGSCDVTRCRAALLHATRLTGGAVPSTAAAFVARARALGGAARDAYAAERFNEARQAACCATLLFESLLTEYECAVEHCDADHIYPSNGVLATAADNRRRSAHAAPHSGSGGAQSHEPRTTLVAFEECDVPTEEFVPDNDLNDAVFAVYATSMVGALTRRWFASALHIETRALGTTSDFALELRLADAHIPAGSRLLLLHHGSGATEECFVANSPSAATADCPSTDVIRLVRSVRSALPHHASSSIPFTNTVAEMALAEPAHLASLYIQVPSSAGVNGIPTLRLAFELRDRATDCVVRTLHFDSARSPHGFGVLAPAPFFWPLEGMPAFINSTDLPDSGLCIGGDRARSHCTERDECAGGYCEMADGHTGRHHCYDAPLPGINSDALCTRISQCPYGKCYGYEGVRSTQSGVYPLLAAHLDSPAPDNAAWYATRTGAVDGRAYYDPEAHRSRTD
jgi:hypothetical protein